MPLKIESTASDTVLSLRIAGNVDENADFSPIRLGNVQRVKLDLEGVAKMNSTGILHWFRFFSTLPPSTQLTIENASTQIIQHLNMMPNLFGNRPLDIRSFFAPYHCGHCDKPIEILLNTAKHFSGDDISSPRLNCTTCGQVLEFDGFAAKYFLFLGRVSTKRG